MSVYHVIFLITLAPAVFYGFRRERDFQFVAIILLVSFVCSYLSFEALSPVWTSAVSDLLFAALIALFCRNRTSIIVGVLFAIAAQVSIFYGIVLQPGMVYHPAYAHTLSVIGHVENLALLYGAADGGIRNWIAGVLRAMGRTVAVGGFRVSASDLKNGSKD